jgi:hypoxanthine phosphoribosyltransferase
VGNRNAGLSKTRPSRIATHSPDAGINATIHANGGGIRNPMLPRRLVRTLDENEFAHPAEHDLARILSFYRIRWDYEPTTFHLEYGEDGRPVEQITPDFYLPDHDMYIELTTMRQRLVTRKNRKIRRLREAFPAVQIKLLYRRDYDRLVGWYPDRGRRSKRRLGRTFLDEEQIATRVLELARELASRLNGSPAEEGWHRWSDEWDDQNPGSPNSARQDVLSNTCRSNGGQPNVDKPVHLIGVGPGSRRFLQAVTNGLKSLGQPVLTDELVLSRYGTTQGNDRVRIGRGPRHSVSRQEVFLITDIVSSGLSLVYITDWLRRKGASGVRVCTLLDREDARIIDVPLDFVGFSAPDEVLVGYGLSAHLEFRDLPFIAALEEDP